MRRTNSIHSTSFPKIFRNNRLLILMITLLLAAALGTGCKGGDNSSQTAPAKTGDKASDKSSENDSDKKADSVSAEENDGEISEGARKIIETFMNCPNSDFCRTEPPLVIGLDAPSLSEEELEQYRAEEEKQRKNWDEAVGEYFSLNCLDNFLSSNAYYYFSLYNGKTVEVKDMELTERIENREFVKVTIAVDGKEQEEQLRFRKNSDGTIWQVNIWRSESSEYI